MRLSRSVESATHHISFLIGLMVAIRVIMGLIVWLLLFLGAFLGYFTMPALLLGATILFYALTDVGLFVTVSRRERAREERLALLRAQHEAKELDVFE